MGAFLALIALGYTMIYGIIRLINFAHGDVFMVGSFIGYTVLSTLVAKHWPWALLVILVLVAGMAFTGVLGMVIERIAYQPLLSAPGWPSSSVRSASRWRWRRAPGSSSGRASLLILMCCQPARSTSAPRASRTSRSPCLCCACC